MDSVKTCFSKIVTFDGRARRSEFWWFAVFVYIIDIVISAILGNGVIAGVLSLIVAI